MVITGSNIRRNLKETAYKTSEITQTCGPVHIKYNVTLELYINFSYMRIIFLYTRDKEGYIFPIHRISSKI